MGSTLATMKKTSHFFCAFAPLLLLLQVSQATPSTPPIFNVHESIESAENVLVLQETMSALGIEKTMLAAVPKDLLYYKEQENISLADSANSNGLVQSIAMQTAAENSFGFFCTIDPLDLQRSSKMAACLEQGAAGIKLYNGYSYSHILPVDDARLSDFYKALADKGGVLLLALNSGTYQNELENLLSLNPELPVICPHYCLASQSLSRLTDLMTRFPNLIVDTSFGQVDMATIGFQTIADNRDAFVQFFTTFQDRILFGTDVVVTTYENKDAAFLTPLYQQYIDVLTKDLNLSYEIQRKVFWQNAANLLE